MSILQLLTIKQRQQKRKHANFYLENKQNYKPYDVGKLFCKKIIPTKKG